MDDAPAVPETGIVAVEALDLGIGAAWSLIPPFARRRSAGELLATMRHESIPLVSRALDAVKKIGSCSPGLAM
jgi:hypothetical protein